MSDVDPFSQVFEGIWTLVEAFAPFSDQVRVGNRIRLDGESRNPIKQNIQHADLPEVILHPGGGDCQLHRNSSQSQVIKRFDFLISTGDLRVDYLHFPLQWHTIRAVANWKSVIGGLVWKGEPFLIDLDIPSKTEGESDPERNRGIKGWSSIITVQARMEFSTNLMRLE